MTDLTGRIALVTGGAVGIGRGIAAALARAGADVCFTWHTHEPEATTADITAAGRQALALHVDVTDSEALEHAVGVAAAQFGRIDILVNNAGGLIERVAVRDMSDAHWAAVLSLNLTSAFSCVKYTLPHMTGRSGRIINVSSQASRDGGGSGAVAYAAAKAGMNGLTAGLAKELGPRGITVNGVLPGLILDTPFHETFTPEARQRAAIEATPVRRAGVPADVAAAVTFLAGDESSFITGALIDVNGGVLPS